MDESKTTLLTLYLTLICVYYYYCFSDDESTVPPGQAGAEIFSCPDDYIVIGGIRLCGDKLNDGSLIEDFTMNAPVTGIS